MKKHLFNFSKLKLFTLCFLGFVCFLTSNLYSQFYEITDYHDPNEYLNETKGAGPLLSEYGAVHTPQGPLKVLLVFVQFEGDDFQRDNEIWEIDSLPDYSDILYTGTNQFDLNNTDLSIRTFITK